MTTSMRERELGIPEPIQACLSPRDAIVESNVAKLRRRLSSVIDVPEYPIDALGPLAEVVADIAEAGQVAPGLVGQSILGAAALLTQSVADVRTMAGVRPLSLFLLSVAESGNAKSLAEEVALKEIREWQREQGKHYRKQLDEYNKAKKPETEAPPRAPYRLVADATVEGLRSGYVHGSPSQGLFTAEGGVFLGGHGMSQENRIKTAATLNSAWDSGDVSVSRQLAGRIELYGRRLTAGIMVQPQAVRTFVNDSMLAGMGFLPRFLLCWAPPALPREAREFRADRHASVRAYWQRCRELLARPLGEDCGDNFLIEFSPQASQVLGGFFEQIEVEAKLPGQRYEHVKAFAIRATEHVCRVAGVLSAWAGDATIGPDCARNAMSLVLHSIDTWAQTLGDREESEAHARAIALYAWLLRQPGLSATIKSIPHVGPRACRQREHRDQAIAILEQAGAATEEGGGLYGQILTK